MAVEFDYMPQLAEAVKKEDDWTGLTNAAARRKRQNRLNQRAYRRRRKADKKNAEEEISNDDSPSSITTASSSYPPCPRLPIHTALALFNTPQFNGTSTMSSPVHFELVPRIAPDYYLITLIQYNVMRAIMTNMSILSQTPPLPGECSPSMLISLPPLPSTIPLSLHPTHLQITVLHPAWIDICPCPQLRDNLILAYTEDRLDEDELCGDLVGRLFDGYGDPFDNGTTHPWEERKKGWSKREREEESGMVVWNDPWDPSGWEIMPGFAKKWAWLLKGCRDLVTASNRWREIRGEEPLIVELDD